MARKKAGKLYERYDLSRSPLAQSPTQRDIAQLVRESRDDLRLLATPHYKEQFLVRRTIRTGDKERDLVYPEARLRAVHERLKFHFNKIIQPAYLMSPRKERTQRDNAATHLEQYQYLTLDIRKFYPSTTRVMIRNSLMEQFGMEADVAGLIAHVATADDRACFGSPLTPVLAAIVHRPMFEAIADLCEEHEASCTVWVDDLTISARQIPGTLISGVREIIARTGLKSHKIAMRQGNRPVFITGVGVVGRHLVVPHRTNLRTNELWERLLAAETLDEYESASQMLLAHLGGVRHVVGPSSDRGRRIADQMNTIRQKRDKRRRKEIATHAPAGVRYLTEDEQLARADEIAAIAF